MRSCGSGNGGSRSHGDTHSSAGRALDLVVAGLAAANALLANLEDLIRSLWEQLRITVVFVTHDIDESIYLAQRVVVLSSSPTRVLSAVAVDLPTDRDPLSTRALPRFGELRSLPPRAESKAW